ncbi:DUF3095 family protein [Zunongwangia atlantica]|uniref:DUF3095 domain-containing protein n=1 Tax=Zunongwangia atlantica 22II14-10F7 TaxID=1185767 RepID=A0A1Y1SYV4_9FLAO|nr:DUF3095 family protein [Zunongwangia atlantica]ORL43951.1 hypothetical protein IIF7_18332 [Zunongwangia atlantica 22II14-10F7]
MNNIDTNFYENLPALDMPVSKLVGDIGHFKNVPENWHIVAADIKNSTEAIAKGQHNSVNLIATGAVIAMINIAYKAKINIPFFFGGDGAIAIIPHKILEETLNALQKHKRNTLKNFQLELKMGSFPVKNIYQENIQLKIAKLRVNEDLNIPIVLGDALHYAEDLIKNTLEDQKTVPDEKPLNLEGMECKWDKIKPPKNGQEVVSLIVISRNDAKSHKTFAEVLKAIDDIYGSPSRRKPISVNRLKLKANLRKINSEMKAKLGKFNLPYLVKSWLTGKYGKHIWLKKENGKNYLKKLVALTDTLTIDGRINTVISGTPQQREALIGYLDNLENSGKIAYGIHISEESIMSCYVRDISTHEHIHFVDGGNGGYTKAAKSLKKKF